MYLLLSKAIVETMRDDIGSGSLVELSKHTDKDIRIGRDKPMAVRRTPYIGVTGQSVPLIGSDATHVQLATVEFMCYAAMEVLSGKLADRIEYLLHDSAEEAGGSDPNSRYWDFSSLDVSIRMSRFINRVESYFDEDTEVWISSVVAEIIWINQPNPFM